MAFGATNGLYWTGNVTANTTNGYIQIAAKTPYVSGTMTSYGLALLATNQNYSFTASNSISSLAASVGTGSITYTNTGPLNIGSFNGIVGVTAGSVALTAGGLTDTADAGITVTNTSTLTINNAGNSYDYSGVIAGPVTLTKSGAGTQSLSAANTYTGGTSITGGTLQSGMNTASGPPISGPFGSGTVTVNGGALDLLGKTIANPLSISGTGFGGNGTIINSSATAGAVTGTVVLTAASAIGGANPYSINGIISGAYGLTKLGANTVTLNATNTYSGTTISGGNLYVGSGGTAGVISGDASIASGARLVFNRSDDITYGGNMSGAGGVTKLGTNILTLTGSGSYTGTTALSGGGLVISNSAPTSTSSSIDGPAFLRIESPGAAFSGAFSTSGWTFGSNLTSVVIGKSINTADITLASAMSINGPITVYGGTININNNIASTLSGAAITFNATADIYTSNTAKTIQTNNGDITLNADSDGNSAGVLNPDYTTYAAGTGTLTWRANTVTWDITSNATKPNLTGSRGAFVFESNASTLGQGIDLTNWIVFPSTLTSLRFGKTTNTSDVNLTGTGISVAGPVTIYGGNIGVNTTLTSTGSGSSILLKGTGSVSTAANSTVQTNNGNLIFWADSDNSGDGFVSIGNGNTLNTANGSSTQTTGGGMIVMAGGLDNGANGGTAADGIPDGYAKSSVAANGTNGGVFIGCLLYTSDAADE